MKTYNVHLFREMRLTYPGIEAESPEAAASIARGKSADEADAIEDCDGEDFAALVDVAGDEDFRHSVTIDFEAEWRRKAASRLVAALKDILEYAESEAYSLGKLKDSPEAEAAAETAWKAIEAGHAAVAEANAAGIQPPDTPVRFAFTYEPEENPDAAYVTVDGKYDVAIKRTAEGLIVDVYPDGWIDPIDTLAVWDDDVATPEHDPVAAPASEA